MNLKTFSSLSKIPHVIFRAFSVYGENEPEVDGHVTGKFIDKLRRNEPLEIEGDGHQTRDFIHVNDIVHGLILSIQLSNIQNEIINLGTGVATSINDLARMVSPEYTFSKARNMDVKHSQSNTCKMKTLLGLDISNDIKNFAKLAEKTAKNEDLHADSAKWIKKYNIRAAPWIIKTR